jgi:nucleoside-diphosphate-sugar epimerase
MGLVVAVTGPTGTFGFGLVPLLEADDRIDRVVGIARRPFDPAEHGWHRMDYRRGDVRDQAGLEEAFAGADVVVHLAFLVTGATSGATARAINVEGTLNVARATAAAGAARFVYASSVAAYGFHEDNPVGMTEEWPTRPADHLFYAQEKAELEELLAAEVGRHPGLALYLLRPPIVLGPHTVGAKAQLPDALARPLAPLAPLARRAGGLLGRRRLPLPVPVPVPDLPMQFVHEEDVGSALLQCIVAAGPPGAYNIAADDVLSAPEVVRELGFLPVPVPARLARTPARAVAALASLPFSPPATAWAEALAHPSVMDTTKAKRDLGWAPRHTALASLRATLPRNREG